MTEWDDDATWPPELPELPGRAPKPPPTVEEIEADGEDGLDAEAVAVDGTEDESDAADVRDEEAGEADDPEGAGDGGDGPDVEESDTEPDEAPLPRPVQQRRRIAWQQVLLLAAGVAVVLAVIAVAVGAASGLSDVAGEIADSAEDQWREWTSELQVIAAGLPEQQIAEQRRLPGSESVLIVSVDEASRATSIALLALSPDGEVTLTLVPPGLFEILPGYGDFPIELATEFEGPELLSLTLQNALGVRIDSTLVLGPGDLERALGGPIVVDLPTALTVTEGDIERVVAQPGRLQRTAAAAAGLMEEQGSSTPIEWLERQAAVWEGILAEAADNAAVTERLAMHAGIDRTDVTGTIAAAAGSDERRITIIPVTRVAARGTEEGFKLTGSEVDAFVDRTLAHLRFREGDRPRVEILNGNGRILTTRTVAENLILKGFRVVKTDNADAFTYEETLVIGQGREHRNDAANVITVLGTGELLLEVRAPSGVVDVSIIVGADMPAGEG